MLIKLTIKTIFINENFFSTIFVVFFSISKIFCQVGINTQTPNSKALLHISEQNKPTDPREKKGIIIPRLSESERNAIPSSASENSLMIYITTEDCYNYWNHTESEWKSLCGKLGKANLQ